MGVASMHPSQRRISCEVCRKHKSRCQRIDQNDPKCARCTILKVECTAGQQKKVGRPRQEAALDKKSNRASNAKPVSAGSRTGSNTIDPWYQQNQPTPLGSDKEIAGDELGRSSMISSAVTTAPAPALAPATDDANRRQAWSPMEVDPFYQDATWDIAKDFYSEFPLANMDSSSGSSISSSDTPATTVSHLAPLNMVLPGQHDAGDGIGTSEAISRLFKINLDLHTRVAVVEKNKATLDLDSLLYVESPLFINNLTLAVFMLKTSHEFLQILTQLVNSRRSSRLDTSQRLQTIFPQQVPLPSQSYKHAQVGQTSTFSSSHSTTASQPLAAPLALTIMSIFTQIISLYELCLKHLTARLERISAQPVAPIPGLTFAGLPLPDPCMQGMLFSNVVVDTLQRTERALGIDKTSESSDLGLLSSRQIYMLWSELDERPGIFPGEGAMRPARVRKLFGKVSFLLTQVSVNI